MQPSNVLHNGPHENLNDPAERRKQVRLKVRPDLQIYEQKYEGKNSTS